MKWIAALLITTNAAVAQCPAPPDHSVRMAEVIAEIQQSDGPVAARDLTQLLWGMWLDAPDDTAQALLERGMAQSESQAFLAARDTFDDLIAYCPDYAEGYNQRAYASFLRRDYPAALVDLEKALDIMPTHIAALSGKALTLIGMGHAEEGQEALLGALALNPWLAERALVTEPAGTDI